MKFVLAAAAACLLSTGASAQAPAARPPATPITPYKIILVGDSTTAVVGGWGPSFCAYHVTSFAACLNLARGGRSSYSYVAEGSWALALNEMSVKGYRRCWVLIQMGHNDQPGKPERSTDLRTEFPVNMKRYVDETRATGCEPVLLTPLTRRIFENGKLKNDLEPWAAAVRKVAAENGVPLVDLNATSAAAVQEMGPDAANRFAQLPPGSAPTGVTAPARSTETNDKPMAVPRLSFDYTHLGREGADYFAAMVTRGLAEAVPDMRPLLIP